MTSSNATDSPIEIQLTRGLSARVDATDADLCDSRWHASDSGPKSKRIYAKRSIAAKGEQRSSMFMHRLIASRMVGRALERHEQVDHINGDSLDNRRSNLRIATTSQNIANSKPQSGRSSRFKGVCWDKSREKWIAGITINYRRQNLGRYDTEEAAYAAYCEAARAQFGDFARLE